MLRKDQKTICRQGTKVAISVIYMDLEVSPWLCMAPLLFRRCSLPFLCLSCNLLYI